MQRRHLALFAAGTLLCGASIASAPQVDVKLMPVEAAGLLSEIQISETLTDIGSPADQALVSVPARIALTMGQAYAANDVTFTDAAGPLPVRMDVDQPPPGMPLQMRSFIPLRAVSGPVTISYKAKVTPALSPRKAGPSYDLRGAEGGVGGSYFSFLLLPLQEPEIDIHLVWDLSGLPAGARVVSTSGSSSDYRAKLPPMAVYEAFFLAGHVNGSTSPDSAFQAYWIGTPPFNADPMVEWTRKSFMALHKFFRD